jgi:hypothetical protein
VILPDSSVPELRAAVAGMLADDAGRRAMGERGRRAAERFGIEAHARAMLEAYHRAFPSIAARRAGPRRDP